jgi:kynurenine formamidase
VIDLSLPIDGTMRGVTIRPAATIGIEGWNATTLSLYSHCGTHMDAPRHFVADASTIDRQDLSICCGQALVIDLTPVLPRELLTIERLGRWTDRIRCGDRLLLRTDWYHRHGSDSYRNELPRVSRELAEWLVERGVALIGVEPPSVADVNDLEELAAVHQTLFRGGVVIVEGLAHLDSITSDFVELFALPLKIVGGDGSPVRAIAIERVSDSEHCQ